MFAVLARYVKEAALRRWRDSTLIAGGLRGGSTPGSPTEPRVIPWRGDVESRQPHTPRPRNLSGAGRYVASGDRSQADRHPQPGPALAAADDVDPPVRGAGGDDVPEGADRRLLPPIQRPGTSGRRLDRRS